MPLDILYLAAPCRNVSVPFELGSAIAAMKRLLTTLAILFSFVATAGVALVIVLVFAGPHSDILPSWLQPVVVVLGWVAVIAIPALVGRAIWRRLNRNVAQQGVHGDDPRFARPAPERGR